MIGKTFRMRTLGAGNAIWEVVEASPCSEHYLCQPVEEGKTHWGIFISRYDLVDKYEAQIR